MCRFVSAEGWDQGNGHLKFHAYTDPAFLSLETDLDPDAEAYKAAFMQKWGKFVFESENQRIY